MGRQASADPVALSFTESPNISQRYKLCLLNSAVLESDTLTTSHYSQRQTRHLTVDPKLLLPEQNSFTGVSRLNHQKALKRSASSPAPVTHFWANNVGTRPITTLERKSGLNAQSKDTKMNCLRTRLASDAHNALQNTTLIQSRKNIWCDDAQPTFEKSNCESSATTHRANQKPGLFTNQYNIEYKLEDTAGAYKEKPAFNDKGVGNTVVREPTPLRKPLLTLPIPCRRGNPLEQHCCERSNFCPEQRNDVFEIVTPQYELYSPSSTDSDASVTFSDSHSGTKHRDEATSKASGSPTWTHVSIILPGFKDYYHEYDDTVATTTTTLGTQADRQGFTWSEAGSWSFDYESQEETKPSEDDCVPDVPPVGSNCPIYLSQPLPGDEKVLRRIRDVAISQGFCSSKSFDQNKNALHSLNEVPNYCFKGLSQASRGPRRASFPIALLSSLRRASFIESRTSNHLGSLDLRLQSHEEQSNKNKMSIKPGASPTSDNSVFLKTRSSSSYNIRFTLRIPDTPAADSKDDNSLALEKCSLPSTCFFQFMQGKRGATHRKTCKNSVNRENSLHDVRQHLDHFLILDRLRTSSVSPFTPAEYSPLRSVSFIKKSTVDSDQIEQKSNTAYAPEPSFTTKLCQDEESRMHFSGQSPISMSKEKSYCSIDVKEPQITPQRLDDYKPCNLESFSKHEKQQPLLVQSIFRKSQSPSKVSSNSKMRLREHQFTENEHVIPSNTMDNISCVNVSGDYHSSRTPSPTPYSSSRCAHIWTPKQNGDSQRRRLRWGTVDHLTSEDTTVAGLGKRFYKCKKSSIDLRKSCNREELSLAQSRLSTPDKSSDVKKDKARKTVPYAADDKFDDAPQTTSDVQVRMLNALSDVFGIHQQHRLILQLLNVLLLVDKASENTSATVDGWSLPTLEELRVSTRVARCAAWDSGVSEVLGHESRNADVDLSNDLRQIVEKLTDYYSTIKDDDDDDDKRCSDFVDCERKHNLLERLVARIDRSRSVACLSEKMQCVCRVIMELLVQEKYLGQPRGSETRLKVLSRKSVVSKQLLTFVVPTSPSFKTPRPNFGRPHTLLHMYTGAYVYRVDDIENFYILGPTIGVGGEGHVKLCIPVQVARILGWNPRCLNWDVVRRTAREASERLIYAMKVTPRTQWTPDVYIMAGRLGMMRHTNLLRYHALYEDSTNFFVLMDFIDGPELLKYLTTGPRLTEIQSRNLFFQILQALEYVHDQQLIHRDVKLENFVCAEPLEPEDAEQPGDDAGTAPALTSTAQTQVPRLLLIDFGLTCSVEDVHVLRPNGTPSYMAPELFLGCSSPPYAYHQCIDIWAAGVVLFQLLSNRMPFGSTGPMSHIEKLGMQKRSQQPPPSGYSSFCHIKPVVKRQPAMVSASLVAHHKNEAPCLTTRITTVEQSDLKAVGRRTTPSGTDKKGSKETQCAGVHRARQHEECETVVVAADDDDDELEEYYCMRPLCLDGDEWSAVSGEAKDLVRRLLAPNPKCRPTAKEALQHPWLRAANTASCSNCVCVCERDELALFQKSNNKTL